MWKVDGAHFDSKRFTPLTPAEVLYEFDGYRVFTFVDADGELNLACWSDSDAMSDRYVVVPTDKKIVESLKSGMMSVREALDQARCWVLDVDFQGQIIGCHRVDFDAIPTDALPAMGTMLLPGMKPIFGSNDVSDESHIRDGMCFLIFTDSKGEYRWRLFAKDGEVIAASAEGYSSMSRCQDAISLVMASAGVPTRCA